MQIDLHIPAPSDTYLDSIELRYAAHRAVAERAQKLLDAALAAGATEDSERVFGLRETIESETESAEALAQTLRENHRAV